MHISDFLYLYCIVLYCTFKSDPHLQIAWRLLRLNTPRTVAGFKFRIYIIFELRQSSRVSSCVRVRFCSVSGYILTWKLGRQRPSQSLILYLYMFSVYGAPLLPRPPLNKTIWERGRECGTSRTAANCI